MPRTIPIALASHIASRSTTMCALIKITPVQPGIEPFGITTLDVDVTYDDGTGALLYSAAIGTEPSTMQAASDLSVAGGESKQLLQVFDTPVTEASLMAGACDYAKFIAYLINYNDLTAGRHIILQSGTMGRSTPTDNGGSWTSEFRGLTQVLKQSITEKYSLSCRAVFGSTVSSAQSRYPCNFDISTLWSNGTVESVGADNTQEFSTSGLTVAYGGSPGLVQWFTGANAGRSDETETFDDLAGSPHVQTVGLTFGSSYPIQVGDTFRYRDDCPKTPDACKARSNFPNYRGEPTIPVSDSGMAAVGNVGSIVSASTTLP
jgi:uncharacterized phage protein (TIGR02218 family)